MIIRRDLIESSISLAPSQYERITESVVACTSFIWKRYQLVENDAISNDENHTNEQKG